MIDAKSNFEEITKYNKFLDNNINCFVDYALTSLDYEKTIFHLKGVITINQYCRVTNNREKYFLIYDFKEKKERLYRQIKQQ